MSDRHRGPWILAACIALLSWADVASPGEDRPIIPSHWGGSFLIGYDKNVIGASDAERDAFGSDNPDYWFVIDRIDDWRGQVDLWARWDIPSFYKELRVVLAYRRMQWANNEILGNDTYEIRLRQKLPDRSRFEVSVNHRPQVYLRHRVDKDAPPGQPRFRPEAVRTTEIELEHSRTLSHIPLTLFVGYEEEDRSRWFNERDERTTGVGLEIDVALGDDAECTPLYEFNESESRNRPDIGTDRSYRQHVLGIRLNASTIPYLPSCRGQLATKWKARSYTTDDPEDESRYDRDDRIYYWYVKIARPLGQVAPFLRIDGAGRMVDLPPGADASDEEGEYTDLVVQGGLEWEF